MNAIAPAPATSPVCTLVPGTLYAVGSGVPADVPVSWIPRGLGGWMPVQCFVLRDGDRRVVIDSGLGVHRDAIKAGLDEVLGDGPPPRALIGRWEPDSMVNLPWLIDRFGVREVLSYGGINPLDFFERAELASAAAQLQAAAEPARLVPIVPGEVVDVGSLRIEVLPVSLRLLLTIWFYEHTTGSLFTADSFGLLANPLGPYPIAVQPTPEMLSPEQFRHGLVTKFDWLIGAETQAIAADLQALARRVPIRRICPSFGAVIEGEAGVDRAFRSMTAALQRLATERAVSPLAAFDWTRALGPSALVDLDDPGRVPSRPRETNGL